MKWYEKFKIGQEVKVIKITLKWNYGLPMSWNSEGIMDKTIGRFYKIIAIDEDLGYALDTGCDVTYTYWYPVESLQGLAGEQLEFEFTYN